MTLFKEIAQRNLPCELCGKPTIAIFGGGWYSDRIYCSDRECGAEYVFPTTTELTNESPNSSDQLKKRPY